MRRIGAIGLGLALLTGWAGTAAAQAVGLGPYGNPPPASATPAMSPADQPAGPPPASPGSATVRMQGKMVTGFGAVSDSARGH